jgi:hypothetical protein
VNLYESLETGTRRKLQNEDNPNGVVLQGFVDSEGIVAIVEGGVARFVTQSGMQACDITKVTRTSVTLFLLETTCGIGTLELLNTDADGRRLQIEIDWESFIAEEDGFVSTGILTLGSCQDDPNVCDGIQVNSDEVGGSDCNDSEIFQKCPKSCDLNCGSTWASPTTAPENTFSPRPSPNPSSPRPPTDDFVVSDDEDCLDSAEPVPDPYGDVAGEIGMYFDCTAIAQLPEFPEKMMYCSNEAVGQACPRSCGYCPEDCTDKPFFETDIVCDETSTPSFCAGNRYACPVTCGACVTP